MKRSLPFLLLASAACSKEQQPLVSVPGPQSDVAVRSACPADTAEIPRFMLAPAAGVADHLAPELVPEPTRGHCEREQNLLAQTEARPRTASTIQTAAGPYLAVHRLRAMAVLPEPKLVLLAAETGLWAHDAETMTRLARVVPNRVVDVVATPSGARFAYVRQDPQTGEAASPRELVVVDTATLAVVRRITGVPEGRMRIANDGGLVLFALGDDGVSTYDVASGNPIAFHTNDTVEDAFPLPERAGTIAYVGHDNAVAFHDLRSGAEVPQSSAGQLPLVTNRDLLTVTWEPSSHRLLAGGADNVVHVYEDMPGAHPRDTKQIRLHGNVVDVTCCAEGAIVATTDSVNVAWIKDGLIVREIGPFLPDAASAPARVGLVGDDTIVSMVGRVFTWTRDGFFVQPDFFAGEEIARATQGDDTILVLRSRGWLEFHRVATAGGLSVPTTLLGTVDWAIIDASFEAQGGMRIFVGRRHGRMVAAYVPTSGEPTFVRGPLVGIEGHPIVTPRGDGTHFGVWNLEDRIAEVDTSARTIRAAFQIQGNRPRSIQLTYEGDHWKVVDEAGLERQLTPIAAEPARQSDMH